MRRFQFGRRAPVLGAWLALILAATSCSCSDTRTTGQNARFASSLQEDPSGKADYLIEFGVVAIGDRKVEPTSIRNMGNRELRLSSARLERPFSHDIPSTGVGIEVGGSHPILFAFEPREETQDPIEVIAVINTNEGDGTVRTVRLVGHGKRARLICDPAALSFGAVPRSSSKTVSTTCKNLLEVELEVTIDGFRGNHAQFFSAQIRDSAAETVTVAPHGELHLDVSFRAESLGANEAALEFRDAFDRSLVEIPVSANAVASTVVVEPETCLDFSYVGVGERATRSLWIRTIGDRPVQVIDLRLPESSREHFSLRTATPLLLSQDGASQEIQIEYHPTSSGAHQTPIEIYTDDPLPDAAQTTACAKGFGGGPAISCTPQRIDFGMVAVGMPIRRVLECMNAGTPIPGVEVDPLEITDVRSTAGRFSATVVDPETRAVGPKPGGYEIGERFVVEVVYSPEDESFDDATIQLETISAPEGVYETTVSGQGRVLPPCDFTVEPRSLRFGVVDRGARLTLPFVIENKLETSCLIHDLRIVADADGAFSVEPIDSQEILGLQSLEVPVTFAPMAYKSLYTAAVEFQISNVDDRHQRVELRGTSMMPCLSIDPMPLDFGMVGPGCTSRERYVTIANVCGAPVEIESIRLNHSLGADAFQIRRRPSLPRTLRENEWEELTLIFSPMEVRPYNGSITIEIEDAEPYVFALTGEAVDNPVQTDTFAQRRRPKVDVLWVIDNSGSFYSYQERIATNLPAFLSAATENSVDYRIAVTTSGLLPRSEDGQICPGGAEGGEDGRFFPIDGSHPRILTPNTPNLEEHWSHNTRVGICHGVEEYFEAAYRALSPPLINDVKSSKHYSETTYDDGNAGFLRREASLSIIFVADEADQSTKFGKTTHDYLAFFEGLKGRDMLRIHAISGSKAGGNSACGRLNGDRFHTLIEATGGTWLDICTPTEDAGAWEAGLKKMSEGAFGFLERFPLRGTPADQNGDGVVNEHDIELRLDGAVYSPIGENKAQRWHYDPASNGIEFTPLFIPKPSVEMSATYRVACGSP